MGGDAGDACGGCGGGLRVCVEVLGRTFFWALEGWFGEGMGGEDGVVRQIMT